MTASGAEPRQASGEAQVPFPREKGAAREMLPGRVQPAAGLVRNVRVGRQGIYDADRTLIAYELQFRSHEEDGDLASAGDRATSQVITSTFATFGVDAIANGRPVFINFTRAFLTGVIPIPVEPAGIVVEVEHISLDDELLAGLAVLKEEGYRLAGPGTADAEQRRAVLELVDYLKVDLSSVPSGKLFEIATQAHDFAVALVATGVDDEQVLTRCVDLGFELFQGPILQRATVLERRTLSPSQLICVRLLRDLSDPDAEIERIEQLVGSDPGLTLRMLRAANSASTGSVNKVTSLRQALVIIGLKRVRSWVVLSLLEGSAISSATEGLWSVLARAFTCQRLGGAASDLAFTIGLLSGAAELLGVSPEAIADGSGLTMEAREAFLDGEGEAGRALTAVLAHERDDLEAVSGTGLLLFDVSRAYLESLNESLALVNELNS